MCVLVEGCLARTMVDELMNGRQALRFSLFFGGGGERGEGGGGEGFGSVCCYLFFFVMDTKEDDLVWESLGLGVTRGGVDAALDLDELEMAAADPAVAAGLRPGADIPALVRSLESQLREVCQ